MKRLNHKIVFLLFVLSLTGCNGGFNELRDFFRNPWEPYSDSADLSFSNMTTTSVNVSWDSATDDVTLPANLEYKLVYSTTGDITSIEMADLSTTAMDWTANTTSNNVTGLVYGDTYYFNVIVRDEEGYSFLYNSSSVYIFDNTAPLIETKEIFSSDVDTTSLTLNWNKASDDFTDVSDLYYKVIYRTSGPIETIDDASDGDILVAMDWTKDVISEDISGLTISQDYYFNILVRDAEGNISIYENKQETPADNIAPTIADKTISNGGLASDSITITFNEASDNYDSKANLEYKIVYSPLGAINSIEEAGDATILVQGMNGWSDYASLTFVIDSLEANTSYNINVLVRDTEGNINIYDCATYSTNSLDPDVNAPDLPADASLTFTYNSSAYTVNISWEKAVDNNYGDGNSAQADLQYRVVSSAEPINSTTDFSNSTILNDISGDGWTQDINFLNDIPIADGRVTYFKVAVKDEANNIAYYDLSSYDNSANLKSSLVGYWRLNNDYINSASSSYNGVLTGTSTWITGFDGTASGALDFNGLTIIDCGDGSTTNNPPNNYSVFTNSNKLTISAWIKVNTFTTSYQTLFSKGNNMWRLSRYGSTGKLHFAVSVGGINSLTTCYVNSSQEVDDDDWHHVAAFYNGDTAEIDIYIDGVKQNSGDKYATTGSLYNFGWSVYIGGNSQTGYTDRMWYGAIDDVRFYNVVLSEAEIKALSR